MQWFYAGIMANCMPELLFIDIQRLVCLAPNVKTRYFVISQPFTRIPLLDFVIPNSSRSEKRSRLFTK